mgnify:CR=1 FL=1
MDEKAEFRTRIDSYLEYIDIKATTKHNYGKILSGFAEYVDRLPNLPKRQDIMAYRELLKSKSKAATVQKHIVVIRNFYRWYHIEGYGPNSAEGVKGMKIESNFKRESLTLEASQKLLHRAKSHAKKDIIGKRNYALIALLLTTGLRTIEVERADVEDISFIDESKVLYIMGKGHDEKDTYVKLSPEVYGLIEEYLIARQDDYKPLFTNHVKPYYGDRIKTRVVSRVVKEMLREIGIDNPKYSAHSLRHTAATLSLMEGANIEETQQLLRHKDPSTTQIYIHRIRKTKDHLEWKISASLFGTTKKKK